MPSPAAPAPTFFKNCQVPHPHPHPSPETHPCFIVVWVPLSRRYIFDVIMWLLNKRGEYMMKSGYHLESIDATPRSLYRSPMQRSASDSPTLLFFFGFMLTRQDLRQFGPKRADSGGNGNRYGRNDHQNRPI